MAWHVPKVRIICKINHFPIKTKKNILFFALLLINDVQMLYTKVFKAPKDLKAPKAPKNLKDLKTLKILNPSPSNLLYSHVQGVLLLWDGVFLEHARTAGTVAQSQHGGVEVEVDVFSILHQVAVVGGGVELW